MQKRVHVIFSGTVQGVGFRYTARRLADKYAVCGWVKNRSDGRVEMLAQEEEQRLWEFLSSLRESFSGYIQNEELTELPVSDDIREFSIRFY